MLLNRQSGPSGKRPQATQSQRRKFKRSCFSALVVSNGFGFVNVDGNHWVTSVKSACHAFRNVRSVGMSDVNATVPVLVGNVKVAAPLVIDDITGVVRVLFVRVSDPAIVAKSASVSAELNSEIVIPTSLSEIPLKSYQEFMRVVEKSNDEEFIGQKTIEIFCGLKMKDVVKVKWSDVKELTVHLNEIFKAKPKFQATFKIDNTEFGFIPNLEDMSFGSENFSVMPVEVLLMILNVTLLLHLSLLITLGLMRKLVGG